MQEVVEQIGNIVKQSATFQEESKKLTYYDDEDLYDNRDGG